MKHAMQQVGEFQAVLDTPIPEGPELPAFREERDLRVGLLREEFTEYLEAENADNIVEIADALADMVYVICGTAHTYGIPLAEVFDEVQRTNMAKFPGGKILRRESDGKVIKPEGWKPPDIAAILADHGGVAR